MNKVCRRIKKYLPYICLILLFMNLIIIYSLPEPKTLNIEPLLKRLDNIRIEAEKEREKSKDLLKTLKKLEKEGKNYKEENNELRKKLKSQKDNPEFLTQYGLFLDSYADYNDLMYEKNKKTYLSLTDYHKYLTNYDSELQNYKETIQNELLNPFWTANIMFNPFSKRIGGSFNIYKPVTKNLMIGGGIGYYNDFFFNISFGGRF